jgi:hypothetical protein
MPLHPNLVLTRSLKTSLSTALYIQRSMKNKNTAHLYESSKRIWLKAKASYYRSEQSGNPDLSHLTNAEKNIRKNSLQMFFEIAAAYGNREVYRVKSSDKSVGPLNLRLNIGGAALRNFAMTQFPFPDRKPLLGFVGDVYGYPGNSLCHEAVPIHNLPELDFIDSCRKHIQVLNTWCYIFDVPPADTARYSNLFLLRARPYLEYIYSEHKYGEAGFREGTVKILRELKNDIAKHYRVRTGDSPTVTSALEHDLPEFSLDFFREQLKEARSSGIVWSAVDELERILQGGSIVETIHKERDDGTRVEKPAPCLTERDAEHFWSRLLELSGQRGSQVHRQITSLFPSFWSPESAMRYGDEFGGNDGYMVGAEIPLETVLGRGRADLVLFRREITPDGLDVFWRPVLVVDIKTRLGFSWDLGFELKKSEARARHGLPLRKVPEFKIGYRSLTESEWTSIIEANPTQNTVEQVNAYADAISGVYDQVSERGGLGPILRATLIVDAYGDIRRIRTLVRSILIEVFESVVHSEDKAPRIVFRPSVGNEKPKVAAILHEQDRLAGHKEESVPAPMVPVQDPFEKTSRDERRFTLYLSGASPTSGGLSAAWTAKYYHGLHLLEELIEGVEKPQVLWVDLANEFVEPHLRTARLCLRPYSRDEKDVFRCQPFYIRDLFDSIEIRGLFHDVQDYLFGDGEIPSIQFESRPNLIAVSGWDTINSATPLPHRERLRELLVGLLDRLPRNADTTIIWFDSPVPGQENSRVYSTRTLLPFYQDSPLFGEATEIVWNLPVAPESELVVEKWPLPVTGTAPLYDDIRVIISQNRRGFDIELTSVPPLIGWSRKFRSKNPEMDLDLLLRESSPDVHLRTRIKLLALDLVPHLLALWPETTIEIDSLKEPVLRTFKEVIFPYQASRSDIVVTWEKLEGEIGEEPGLLERVRFRPKGPMGAKAYMPIAKGSINSQRLYRSSYELRTGKRPSFERPLSSDAPLARIAFGRFFVRSDEQSQDELLVMEDVHDRTRLLVGLFTENSRQDHSGFIWVDSDIDRLEEVVSEDLDSLASEDILIVYKGDKMERWQLDPDTEEWVPSGIVEVIAGGRSRVSSISAIRNSPSPEASSVPRESPPQSFGRRIKLGLKRLVDEQRALTRTKVAVRDMETGCEVRFVDEADDVVVQTVKVEGTPDLVRLLRQPLGIEKPLRTGKGEFIIWDPFADIDYGEFESVRPFVETGAPRGVGRALLPRVHEITEPREEIPLELILKHDNENCPLVANSGTVHDRCWLVTSEVEESFVERFRKPMTGREVYGHLAPGRVETRDMTYNIRLSLGHRPYTREFYVYHEDRWIRRLLHEEEKHLRALPPGTFLGSDEKWMVTFTVEGNDVEWSGISDASNLYWKGRVFRFSLNPTLDLEQALNDFLGRIAEEIPVDSILNLDDLQESIRNLLSSHGYGEKGPEFHLAVSREGQVFTVTLTQIGGGQRIVVSKDSFKVDKSLRRETIMDDFHFQLDDGELSKFNIINQSRFLEDLQTLLDEIHLRD